MSSEFYNDRHLRVREMLGHTLTLGDDLESWDGLSLVLLVRLNTRERKLLLATVLDAMDLDDILDVLECRVTPRIAGAPLPVFDQAKDDAAWWAGFASMPVVRAMLATCFNHLPMREQREFLDAAIRRLAA